MQEIGGSRLNGIISPAPSDIFLLEDGLSPKNQFAQIQQRRLVATALAGF
jgi:hypothetical protein